MSHVNFFLQYGADHIWPHYFLELQPLDAALFCIDEESEPVQFTRRSAIEGFASASFEGSTPEPHG